MLDHLLALDPEPYDTAAEAFVALEAAHPSAIFDGKASTEQWLREMGAESPTSLTPRLELDLAAKAFSALTGASPASKEEVKNKLWLCGRPSPCATPSAC